MRAILMALAAVAGAVPACADPMTNGLPPVNTPMAACIEGRTLRYIGGQISCAPATAVPTITGCGTGASISPNATDYSGVVSVGSGAVTSCTVNFTVPHTNPGIGCVSQSYGTAAIFSPVVTSTQIQQGFGVSLGGGQFSYICFPK